MNHRKLIFVDVFYFQVGNLSSNLMPKIPNHMLQLHPGLRPAMPQQTSGRGIMINPLAVHHMASSGVSQHPSLGSSSSMEAIEVRLRHQNRLLVTSYHGVTFIKLLNCSASITFGYAVRASLWFYLFGHNAATYLS